MSARPSGLRIAQRLAAWRRTPGFRALALALAAGAAVRLALVLVSTGSDDAYIWERFGRRIAEHGLLAQYERIRWFNHPPLMGAWAAAAATLADLVGIRFAIVFKLPVVAMDLAVVGLLWRARAFSGLALGWIALQPANVLVSAYHGNTDCLCIGLGFASALLLERGRPAAAGLALAASINLKHTSVLLVVPFLLQVPRRDLARFAGALAVGALPFVPVLIGAGEAFVRNAILYRSFPAPWGLGVFLAVASERAPEVARALTDWFLPLGKWAIVAASLGVALANRWLRCWGPVELGALVFSIFLVLAPGFGVQYVVYPIALLFAARWRTGLEYSALAGLFVSLVYYDLWPGGLPVRSKFEGGIAMPFVLIGLLAWFVLLRHCARELARALRA